MRYLRLERGLADNTIVSYEFDIKKYLAHLNSFSPKIKVVNAQPDDVREFLYQMAHFVSSRTQARLLSSLNSFYDYLVLEKYTDNHPVSFIELPQMEQKLPEVLTVEEINLMVNYVKNKSYSKNSIEDTRNSAIIETIYGCGLRVSELINLQLSDLFFDEGFVKITGKGNKDRLVPIGKYTQNVINEYLSQRQKLIIHPKHINFFVFE